MENNPTRIARRRCAIVVSSSIRALWTTTSLLLYYSIAILSTEATRKKPGVQVYRQLHAIQTTRKELRETPCTYSQRLIPWDEVAVDLIGPWSIEIHDEQVEFKALTCIDMVTNLAEIIRIDNKSSQHIADQFQNCWLAQYPFPPNRCVHDNNDGKFLGQEFQTLLSSIHPFHPFLPCILGSK